MHTYNNIITEYRDELIAVLGKRYPAAQSQARRCLYMFDAAARRQGVVPEQVVLELVTRADVLETLADLRTRVSARGLPLATNTIRRYFLDSRNFLNWAVRRGYVSENLFNSLPTPPQTRPKVQALSRASIVALFDAADASRWPARSRLLTALVVMCGLRRAEIVGLDMRNLFVESGVPVGLTFYGKNGKARWVPFAAPVRPLMTAYLEERSYRLRCWQKSSPALIITAYNMNRTDLRIGYAALGFIFDKALRAGGVRKSGQLLHAGRRAFATHALQSGSMNPIELMQACGWSQLSSALHYVEVTSEDLTRAFSLHPLLDLVPTT